MIRIATRRPAGSTAATAAPEDLAALQAAAAALARALLDLAHLRGILAASVDRAGEGFVAWADDNDFYVEVHLPEDPGTDIDASTCGRTVMVRVARGR